MTYYRELILLLRYQHTYRLIKLIKTTALSALTALFYSTTEYACPVWELSTHVDKIDPELNNACRAITIYVNYQSQ